VVEGEPFLAAGQALGQPLDQARRDQPVQVVVELAVARLGHGGHGGVGEPLADDGGPAQDPLGREGQPVEPGRDQRLERVGDGQRPLPGRGRAGLPEGDGQLLDEQRVALAGVEHLAGQLRRGAGAEHRDEQLGRRLLAQRVEVDPLGPGPQQPGRQAGQLGPADAQVGELALGPAAVADQGRGHLQQVGGGPVQVLEDHQDPFVPGQAAQHPARAAASSRVSPRPGWAAGPGSSSSRPASRHRASAVAGAASGSGQVWATSRPARSRPSRRPRPAPRGPARRAGSASRAGSAPTGHGPGRRSRPWPPGPGSTCRPRRRRPAAPAGCGGRRGRGPRPAGAGRSRGRPSGRWPARRVRGQGPRPPRPAGAGRGAPAAPPGRPRPCRGPRARSWPTGGSGRARRPAGSGPRCAPPGRSPAGRPTRDRPRPRRCRARCAGAGAGCRGRSRPT
jgi:hypothetical protein